MPPVFLILWMTTAQANAQAEKPVATPPAAPATTPATGVVQCAPSDCERALRAQLDEARSQLDQTRSQLDGARSELAEAKEQVAKLKEEAGMPDHAVAALLVSDRPDLAPLKRVMRRPVSGAGMRRIRAVQAEVYVSPDRHVTMAAVVLTTRNPREAPTWEPTEGLLMTSSFWRDPPVPVAVRSSPERIRPGETARIAVVFDLRDVRLDDAYATVALFRDGKWEMESELQISDFLAAAAISRGGQ